MENFIASYWPLILAIGVVAIAVLAVEWNDRQMDKEFDDAAWREWAKRNGGKK